MGSSTTDRSMIREYNAGIRALGGEGNERKFELSFSSEEPYTRYWGVEILDHGEGCMDLTRLQEIGCVLFNHNRDAVIAKVNRVWTENNRGKAEIEFDTDEDAEKIYQKVKSGTLKGVSVGYVVDAWEEVLSNKESADGRFKGPCRIARKWTPYGLLQSMKQNAMELFGAGIDINVPVRTSYDLQAGAPLSNAAISNLQSQSLDWVGASSRSSSGRSKSTSKTTTKTTTKTRTKNSGSKNTSGKMRSGLQRNAVGGIFDTPQVGWYAEAGNSEALIPLDGSKRAMSAL